MNIMNEIVFQILNNLLLKNQHMMLFNGQITLYFLQNVGLDTVFQRPNDDAQLQAAYELQLWKESKELEFERHVWTCPNQS